MKDKLSDSQTTAPVDEPMHAINEADVRMNEQIVELYEKISRDRLALFEKADDSDEFVRQLSVIDDDVMADMVVDSEVSLILNFADATASQRLSHILATCEQKRTPFAVISLSELVRNMPLFDKMVTAQTLIHLSEFVHNIAGPKLVVGSTARPDVVLGLLNLVARVRFFVIGRSEGYPMLDTIPAAQVATSPGELTRRHVNPDAFETLKSDAFALQFGALGCPDASYVRIKQPNRLRTCSLDCSRISIARFDPVTEQGWVVDKERS